MVFLKEFYKKADFEKYQQTTTIQSYPVGKELYSLLSFTQIPG